MHVLGDKVDVVAVCQPSVHVVAAVSVMEAERDTFVRVSMTLMGGPIETRRNATGVNKLVAPSKITRVALMTVEGEKDDISGLGQTEATHALCSSIPDHRRVHYVQKGVGHYGVFNVFFSSRRRHTRCGRDWSSDVCSSDLDYDNLAQFIPDMKSSRVVSRSGDRVVVEQKGEIGFFFYRQPVDVTLEVLERPQRRIVARSEERRVGKECRSRWSPYH